MISNFFDLFTFLLDQLLSFGSDLLLLLIVVSVFGMVLTVAKYFLRGKY